MARTRVFRLFYSLAKPGYVDEDPVSNLNTLSGRFFEMDSHVLPRQRLTILAKPFMQALAAELHESINLAIPMNSRAPGIPVRRHAIRRT